MQTIRVHTTQNVYIHYPLASVGDRMLGFLIDELIVLVYVVSTAAAFIKFDIETTWLWIVVVGLPRLFFKFTCEILMNGQTPGKRLMKIKVVRLDGTPPTLGDYLLRWMFSFVDFFMLGGAVALVCIAAGGKGQRLGDIVAGTSVVKLSEQKEIDANELFVQNEDNYEPVFHQAASLTSNDIELIQQALEVNKNFGNDKPVRVMAEKIKSVLGIETDLPPVKFLYTVIRDYQHITTQVA